MKFIPDVTAMAKSDMRNTLHWLVTHISRASAHNWRNRIRLALNALSHDAGSCPLAHESADMGLELREKPCGNRPHVYRILFTIEDSTVTIHRVRHAAQDWLTPEDF